jgi:hypothetical protein
MLRALPSYLRNPLSIIDSIPTPFGHKAWADAFFAAFIVVLQATVLPTILPSFIIIDLLTPWLAVSLVLLPWRRSLPLVLFSALLVETHTGAPAGFYLTTYWMLGISVALCRHAISWSNRMPWLSLVIFSETWMFAAEFIVALLSGQEPPIDLKYYLIHSLRIAISSYFGYTVATMYAPDIRRGDTADG